MPAFANLVTEDWGALGVTPVVQTFVPNTIDSNGVAHYVVAGASALDDKKASVSLRRTADQGKIRFQLKFALPVTATETINGVASPKLLRTIHIDLVMTADQASSIQERGDAMKILATAIQTVDTNTWTAWTTNLGIF